MLLFRWTDATRSIINCGAGWFVPVDDANMHYHDMKSWLHLVRDHDAPEAGDADIRTLMNPAETQAADVKPEPETSGESEAGATGQTEALKPADETSAASEASSIGLMIDNRAGIMAADRLGELQTQRIGEVVDYAERLLERRFSDAHRHRWQVLWSSALAAQSNSAPALTEQERAEFDRLSVDERWASLVADEQKKRVKALRAMTDSEGVLQFNAREGWPT